LFFLTVFGKREFFIDR